MTGMKTQRERSGLTQAQFAQKVKVHPLSVSRWETGKSTPTVKRLKEIAQLLNCTTDELL